MALVSKDLHSPRPSAGSYIQDLIFRNRLELKKPLVKAKDFFNLNLRHENIWTDRIGARERRVRK